MTGLIIFSATYLVALVALVCIAALVVSRRIELVYTLMLALAIGWGIARILGLFISHTQPFDVGGFEPLIPHEVNNSFPSDHTLVSGIAAAIAWLHSRSIGALLFASALLVGTARVAAGLHYPVDIAASLVLAVCAVWAARQSLALVRRAA